MNKTFIAISSLIQNNKLVYLTTSFGNSLYNENGITANQALDFLFSLVWKRQAKKGLVFVVYGFSRSYEHIFSNLPDELKDKLFESHTFKEKQDRLEYELEQIENDLYRLDENTQDYEQADFERYVNKLSLKENAECIYKNYHINLRNGKILTIRRGGKSISIYDVFGFFKPKSLYEATKIWLKKDICLLNSHVIKTLDYSLELSKDLTNLQCYIISTLAEKLEIELKNQGIYIRNYYGATAITSYLLGKWKAKDYFYNYRYPRQLSPELYKAMMQAYYGGRSDQFKIGTIKDVNIYDINSAYAFACTFLPIMLRKPHFVDKWKNEPFGLFCCEYDFTNINLYFGFLPNRDSNNLTRYKTKGKGYFWQPEILYVLQNHPKCIDIKHGFVLDYVNIPFAENIQQLYNLRLKLQRENNPLEKVIKLALSSIYGKFCQHNGKGRFYNMFYAGFITSFVRMMLLEATKGNEEKTICFQTDAIHTTANLPVNCGDKLGDYKQSKYRQVTYLDNGVYKGRETNGQTKIKNRGFKTFNFEKALNEMQTKLNYSGDASFFIGHNLNELEIFNADYLSDYNTNAVINPLEDSRTRIFENRKIDFENEFLDSEIIKFYNGQESLLYRQSNRVETDTGLELAEAMRV